MSDEQISDIELVAGVIRTIEEVRSDMRTVGGLPAGSDRADPLTDASWAYWHDRLLDMRAHLQIVYSRMISAEIPRIAAGMGPLTEYAPVETAGVAVDLPGDLLELPPMSRGPEAGDDPVVGFLLRPVKPIICVDPWHVGRSVIVTHCPTCNEDGQTDLGQHANSGPG